MYCDEVQLEADTVLATLYVAKKYIVPHLARACVNYLETSLTAKNACLLLSQSRLFEEPDLMQRCWEVIDAQVSLNLKPLILTANANSTKEEISEEKIGFPSEFSLLSFPFYSARINFEFDFGFKKAKSIQSFLASNPLSSFNSCFLFDIKWNNHKKYSLYRGGNEFHFLKYLSDVEVKNTFFRDNYAALYRDIQNNFEGCDNDVLEC